MLSRGFHTASASLKVRLRCINPFLFLKAHSHSHSLSPILSSPLSLSPSPIPMPLAADVNANLLRSLKVVQSIGEAVPHGGILKAVAGIGIMILETADVRYLLAPYITAYPDLDSEYDKIRKNVLI